MINPVRVETARNPVETARNSLEAANLNGNCRQPNLASETVSKRQTRKKNVRKRSKMNQVTFSEFEFELNLN